MLTAATYYFVALCRTAGVPSRIDPVWGKAQYFGDNQWHTVFDTEHRASVQPKPALVELTYDDAVACKYSVHFSIARFEDGLFNTLTYEYGRDVKDFPKQLELQGGHYMLVTGNRLSDGSVLTRVAFFNLAAGASYQLPVVVRKENSTLKALGHINLPSFLVKADGSKIEVGQLINTYGGVALVWIDPGKEPTRHVLKDLKEMKEVFDKSNIPLVFFVPEEKQTAGFDASSYVLPQNATFARDTDLLNQLSAGFQRKLTGELPVIVMVNAKGEVLYFSAGYKIGTCEQLLKTYQQVIHPNGQGTTCRMN
jgi:hypothetical protein